ncbi:hypothetical protein [Actinomadura luteofluorescens]|uniref:hypothetical protein n=1 Tax=Actinomadura luteofluorescens TaxID=46163 RepID=UPI00216404AF|nr:hypothetical protein [Actinomadura glauciflava]
MIAVAVSAAIIAAAAPAVAAIPAHASVADELPAIDGRQTVLTRKSPRLQDRNITTHLEPARKADCRVTAFADLEDRTGYVYGAGAIDCRRPQARIVLSIRLYRDGRQVGTHVCDADAGSKSCDVHVRIYDKWRGKQKWRASVTGLAAPDGKHSANSIFYH